MNEAWKALPTPAVVIDLDTAARNVRAMRDRMIQFEDQFRRIAQVEPFPQGMAKIA